MRTVVYSVAGILVLFVGTLWFNANYEHVEKTRTTGFAGEARYNRFLAASLLFNEMDIPSASARGFDPGNWLPDVGDTLVTVLDESVVAFGDDARLMDNWIRSGGHLVVMIPDTMTRQGEGFLTRFGLSVSVVEESGSEEASDDAASDEEETSYSYELALNDVRHRIDVTDELRFAATLSDDEGVVVLRQMLDEGYLSVITGDELFDNYSIDEMDHARLLLDVIAGSFEPGKVWFFYSAESAGLWLLLWRSVPLLIGAAILWFVLWAWSRMPRFGPRLASLSEPPRSIVEHIAAAGRFSWRLGAQQALAQSSVDAVVVRAARLHPGLQRLSVQKQAHVVARITGREAQEVLEALHAGAAQQPKEFAERIRKLQSIRNAL